MIVNIQVRASYKMPFFSLVLEKCITEV